MKEAADYNISKGNKNNSYQKRTKYDIKREDRP